VNEQNIPDIENSASNPEQLYVRDKERLQAAFLPGGALADLVDRYGYLCGKPLGPNSYESKFAIKFVDPVKPQLRKGDMYVFHKAFAGSNIQIWFNRATRLPTSISVDNRFSSVNLAEKGFLLEVAMNGSYLQMGQYIHGTQQMRIEGSEPLGLVADMLEYTVRNIK